MLYCKTAGKGTIDKSKKYCLKKNLLSQIASSLVILARSLDSGYDIMKNSLSKELC